jgi:S-DNA-T family DNA segregation ATPase FtsK/SpoIIIE
MVYWQNAQNIQQLIRELAHSKIIWADTEVADWQTQKPRLSLIQVLSERTDLTGKNGYILDVLDRPDLVTYFIQQIMIDWRIEKVFHNASYDLRFLGKSQAKNVTCTLKMAKQIGRDRLGVTNLKLKTLAAELCHFADIHLESQTSDWGQRPLSQAQLNYAKMDVVYLSQVHQYLLHKLKPEHPNYQENFMPQEKSAASTALTATDLRVALECPRLFYLGQRFGGMTLFLPPNEMGGIGNPFHDLAKKFTLLIQENPRFKDGLNLPIDQINPKTVALQMQQLFYELVFLPYLQNAIAQEPKKIATLNQIWQGLQGLIRRYAEILVANRRDYSAEEVINKTFLGQELTIHHWFDLPDEKKQLVRGQLDSLILKGDRLCVVEYKTYEPADLTAQLAQVALYSYMLFQDKKQPVDSAVYCVLPEFKELLFSWEELEAKFHQLIPHKLAQMRQWLTWEPPQPNPPPPTPQPQLCEICSQRNKCQSFFAENSAQFSIQKVNNPPQTPHQKGGIQENIAEQLKVNDPPQPPLQKGGLKENIPLTPIQKEGLEENIAQQLIETLASFKISVDYLGAAVGPAFIRVKLKPHLGVKVAALVKLSADLQVQLGISFPPMISPQAGYVSVDLPRSDRQVAQFESYIQRQQNPVDAAVKIAIGIDLDGQLIEADLSDPNTCHFLVGGTTGSGKSEFLRSLLLSLLYRHSPDHLKIALVDPKRVTFPEFAQMRWLYSPVVKDSESAIELMTELVAEMESRYRRFEAAGCADIHTYNQKKYNQPLPRIVCIFDEYADFMAEKETRNELELSIKRLGAMARAAGIHLIIATQRPEAKVVTPIIRSNLPGRVALRTASEADSMIILGGKQTAAAYLLGKGDLLYQVGAQLQRLQSLFCAIAPRL